ncbi:MAG: hypothetical protein KQJ78_19305 [Deltaproteobacteria bacterium]|nr:hypothetical protein [Deltaproteobacteria bacterium]
MPRDQAAPWAGPEAWARVWRNLQAELGACGPGRARLAALADEAARALAATFPLLDRLTPATCPVCREVCCQKARVVATSRDLLFFAAAGLPPPPAQLRDRLSQPCRHLGPTGCRLPRLSRPFLCNWWLCPALGQLLRGEPEHQRRGFRQGLVTANRALLTLEQVFTARPGAGDRPPWDAPDPPPAGAGGR